MRLTEEQYLELTRKRKAGIAAGPAAQKYRNIATKVDGRTFDSKLEANYYRQLVARWQRGEILWFTCQVPFWLEGGVKYVADFVVVERTGVRVVDTTGMLTQVKANKLKQMKARYGIDVEVIGKVEVSRVHNAHAREGEAA